MHTYTVTLTEREREIALGALDLVAANAALETDPSIYTDDDRRAIDATLTAIEQAPRDSSAISRLAKAYDPPAVPVSLRRER